MKLEGTSPKGDGYRMIAETFPHEECFLVWPERPDNWRNGGKPVQKVFAQVAEAIAKFEPVTMLVSKGQYLNARQQLSPKVRVLEMSNNDAWLKDTAPIYVMDEHQDLRGVDFRFNAWGGLLDGLFFPWDQDDLIAQKLCELNRIDFYSLANFVLEGCSIHTDGEGTLFATEECLLSEGRNPQFDQQEIESLLKEYCGIEKVIWIERGFFLDETNGDIDNMLNVVAPGEIVLNWTDDPEEVMYDICHDAYERLQDATDAKGRKLKIHKMPLPQALYITEEESKGVDPVNGLLPRLEGDRLTASYVSYYTANGGLIVPQFGDPNDEVAVKLLRDLYPDYEIIGIPAREVLLGGGSLHCIASSLPKYGR